MAQITAKDLSLTINVGNIEEEVRAAWEQKQKARRGLVQWMVRALPLGLLIMLVVFYTLSAPHTAGLIEKITPGWGMVAPIGFELGVLIVSMLIESGWKNKESVRILRLLLGISIAINVGGGLISVITSSLTLELQRHTIQDLLARLPELPAEAQIVLIFLVIPMGVTIPVMSKWSGETLIKMALGKVQLTTESDEDRWLRERRKVLQQGLFSKAITMGAGQATAGEWSQRMVYQWYREAPQEHAVTVDAYASSKLPDGSAMPAPVASRDFGFGGIADNRTTGQYGLTGNSVQEGHGLQAGNVHNVHENPDSGRTDSGQTSGRKRDAREIVREYLKANPDSVNMNVRSLADLLRVGKSTVSEVQREFREGK